jgi:hypothetical protein
MPGGLTDPVAGYIGYFCVKAAGYTVAATVISRTYSRSDLNPFAVGSARTVMGMAAGLMIHELLPTLDRAMASSAVFVSLAVLGLICITLAEWWLLIWMFYDRHLSSPRRDWAVTVCGTVWSFILDVPAVFVHLVAGKVHFG